MFRLKNILMAMFCTAASVQSSIAQNAISGSSAPEFQTALSLWLNGEDMKALEGLAQAARSDNRAAQILLAGIANRGKLHAHVTGALPRKDRVSLLRIPQGLSGQSWLTAAQADEPLATALLQATRIGEKAPAIAALFVLGEPQQAMLAAQSMLFQGEAAELITVLEGLDETLPDEASVLLAWSVYQNANADSGRYVGSARVGSVLSGDSRFHVYELAWQTPPPKFLIEDEALRDTALRLSGEVAAWTPVRQFCDANCTDTVAPCTVVGASLLGMDGPFPMRSPAESLISNDDYWESARIQADLARSTLDVRSFRDYLGTIDMCFFDQMTPLQAEYGFKR